jgi:hypothetical protein
MTIIMEKNASLSGAVVILYLQLKLFSPTTCSLEVVRSYRLCYLQYVIY